MTGYTMDNSGAGFNDDSANNNRPPDMDDLESIILADGGYSNNQMDDGDVKPNADLLNIANPAGVAADVAGDEDGEFRSRCNTWPKREQLSTLSVLDQQRLELQQLQQQQEQSMDQLSYNSRELPQQEQLHQQDGYPSPCGPLPLVCEEDSTAMESETTNMDIKEEEPNPDSPQQISSSSSSSSSTAATNTTAPGTPTLAAKSGARRNPWGNLSYADLITQAIQSSHDQRLTLAQIYDWLVKNVPYFAAKADSVSSIGWKNSIRHNLSLHSRFVRVQNEGAGKSSWWMVDMEAAAAKQQQQQQSANHHHNHHKHNSSSHQHSRRRANTLDTTRFERRRSRNGGAPSSLSSGGLGPKRLSRSRDQLKRTSSANNVFVNDAFVSSNPPPAVTTPPNSEISVVPPSSSPEHFPGPFRARTSSNASSCGRASPAPFRPRTLSNASDKLHPSPPSLTEPFSPCYGFQHTSPNSTIGYNDVAGHAALDEALNKINIDEGDDSKQQEMRLTDEDQASLRLLDLTLNPEASQKIMEALCASQEASGILESIKQEQMQGQQFPPSPQQQQQLAVSDSEVDAGSIIKDETSSASVLDSFGFGQQQQQPDLQQLPNQARDVHKLKILEQRESAGSNGLPYDVLDIQQPEKPLLQQDISKTDSPSLGLVQALTAPSSLLQRTRPGHHHNLHHVHSHNHHHLSKIRQQRHLRHALRQQLQQQLQLQQQQIKQQQQAENIQQLSARLQEEQLQQQQQDLPLLGPLSVPPSSSVAFGDHLSEDANGCGGALTPVTESANEDGGGTTNEFYEEFLRITQGEDGRQQQPEPPPVQQVQVQQQQQPQQQQRLGDREEEDEDIYLQNLVDPISVGGFPSSSTTANSSSNQSATVSMGSF